MACGFGGITLAQTYNNRLQPSTIVASSTNGTVLDFTYCFNANFDPATMNCAATPVANNGNVAFIANNRNTNRTQKFSYDELNRVKTAQSAATSGNDCWGLQFGYDIWANLLSSSVTKCSPPALSVGVNTKNQISNANFQYDAAGNLAFDGSLSATYDAENRITSTNGGVSYTYDGDGKRVKKSNGKLYWYGSGSDPQEETDLSGVASAEYIFFGGKRTARLDLPGAAVHYYFANHLGSASVVTSSTGAIQDESDYYPFGGERVVTDTDPNQYKFSGKERDTESGLDFFIARYYSSQYGRFLTPDWAAAPTAVPYAEFGNPQSLNLYAYVKNNPMNASDPGGHDTQATLDPKATQEAGQVIADVIVGAAKGAWNMFAGTVNLLNSQANAISNLVSGNDVAGYAPLAEYSNTTQMVVGNGVPVAIAAQGAFSESFAAASKAPANTAGVQANRTAGLAYQNSQAAETAATDTNVVQNLRVRTISGTRTEIDIASKDSGGAIRLQEAKASQSARLTPNQAQAHPEIQQSGATVVSQNKPGYPAGSRIPPTKVEVVRAKD